MGRFKGGLRCKGWANSVIINGITVITYMPFFLNISMK